MNTASHEPQSYQWPRQYGQSIVVYAIEGILECHKNGIVDIPENIITRVDNAFKDEIQNSFIGHAFSDSVQLCFEAMPDEPVANLEALIRHVLTVDDFDAFLVGSFAKYFDENEFSFFGDAADIFQSLYTEESLETTQNVCVFLTMVALVRYVGSNGTEAGQLLSRWNEYYIEFNAMGQIQHELSMGLLKWVIAFYTTMNEYTMEYEDNGVFGTDCDLDFYDMTIRFVNTNNIRGIHQLITFGRFWIDQDNQTGSFLDLFASRELEPSTLYAIMDFLGGKFQQNSHIFETAFMDWMSTGGMIATIIDETEISGHINRDSHAYDKLLKSIDVLQMLLAHSPDKHSNMQGQWNVSLPFKFLLWILRSFGLQETQLQTEIVLWIVHNGERPIRLFSEHGTFCGLRYGSEEYGKHIMDFLKLSIDKAQPFEDNKQHMTTFCTETATLHAIHAVTTELFNLFKQNLTSEIQGCVLQMNDNCYSKSAIHYNLTLFERYANDISFNNN